MTKFHELPEQPSYLTLWACWTQESDRCPLGDLFEDEFAWKFAFSKLEENSSFGAVKEVENTY